MNNDGSGNILQTNFLLPPHDIGFFDVIVTNPSFLKLGERMGVIAKFSKMA